LEIHNARTSTRNAEYADLVYSRLQRRGYLHRDCQRMINLDRNVFGAAIVASGHADGMVTGLTRTYSVVLEEIRRVIDPKPDQLVIGVSIIIARGRTVLVADTNVTELPSASEIADIAQTAARVSRKLGQEPRVALLAYSTFGNPMSERSENMRKAKKLLDERGVDFDYDGEMSADVALNRDVMKLYPFSNLKEPANVLIMPAIHSANISTKLLQELGGSVVIGPLLVGLSKPIQIVPMGSTVSDLVQIAAFSAFDLTG
jgi:malate dehydrogenase (oxaloacetate-decarboxylating)(NADP+)